MASLGTIKKHCALKALFAAFAFAAALFARPMSIEASSSAIKELLYIKVESATYVYDGQEHSIASYTSNAQSSYYSDIKVMWDLRLSKTDAGSYSTTDAMSQSIRVLSNGEDVTDFFQIHITHGTLTIRKAQISIQVEDVTKEYSGQQQTVALGYSSPAVLGANDFISSSPSATGKNAGIYAMDKPPVISSRTRGIDVTKNYDISLTGGSLNILPNSTAIVSIEPESKSILYGEKQPPLTAKITGALGSDASAFTYTIKRELGDDAGTYKVNVSGYTDNVFPNKNYKNIRAKAGAFTIQAAITYKYTGKEPEGAQKAPQSSGATVGQSYTVKDPPKYSGYEFSGWKTKDVKVSQGRFTVPQGINEIVFTGSFKSLPFTLTYIVDGKEYKKVSYAAGERVIPLAEPTRDGETFAGWDAIPSVMPSTDVEVHGSFSGSTVVPEIRFRVDYYIDNQLFATQSYLAGDRVKAPSITSDMNISGWEGVPAVMPARDVSLYAIASEGKETNPSKTESGNRTFSPANIGLALLAITLCVLYNLGVFGRKHPKKTSLRVLGALSALTAAVVAGFALIASRKIAFFDIWTPVCAISVAIQLLIPMRFGKKVYVDDYDYDDNDYMYQEAEYHKADSEFEATIPEDPRGDKGEIPAM